MQRRRAHIAVVGSYEPAYKPGEENCSETDKKTDSDYGRFESACKALGSALAENGNTIVLYMGSWDQRINVSRKDGDEASEPDISELNKGKLPESLRMQFEREEIRLAESPDIEVIEKDTGWIVPHIKNDGSGNDEELIIIREPGRFAAYLHQRTVCDIVLEGARNRTKLGADAPCHVFLSVPGMNPGTGALTLPRNYERHGVYIKPSPRPSIRKYYPESFPSVNKADAIIAISGGKLTEMVACVAHYVSEMPVVVVPSFGGAASYLYNEVFAKEYEEHEADPNVSGWVSALNEPWALDSAPRENQIGNNNSKKNKERAKKIVRFTEHLIQHNRRRASEEHRRQRSLLRSTRWWLGLWLVLFCFLVANAKVPENTTSTVADLLTTLIAYADSLATPAPNRIATSGPVETPPPESDSDTDDLTSSADAGSATPSVPTSFMRLLLLWVMLFMAAQLGVRLKIAASYEAGEIVDLESQPGNVTTIEALVLALGLGLLYFIGGWSFAGEVEFPWHGDALISAAVVMSLLGLAGGFLLPVEELRGRLQLLLSSNDESDTTQ